MRNRILIALTAIIVLLSASSLFAQDEVENVRIDLNLGYPIIYTVGLEYVFPFFGDRIAINADLGYLPLGNIEDDEDFDLTIVDWSANLRFYFFGEGEGLNFTVGFFQANFIMTDEDYVGDGGIAQKAEGTVALNYGRLMLGYRWVWGHFTLSLNGGYSFLLEKNASVDVTYAGYTASEKYDLDELPKALRNPIFVTVGFGFAF